ncbi:hypothetical protein ANCDUO_00945, partial [Ancylostoma duodenale]
MKKKENSQKVKSFKKKTTEVPLRSTEESTLILLVFQPNCKLKNVGHAEKIAHKQCNKDAKTVKQHANCVVMLMEAEKKYQRWLKKFGEKKKRVEHSESPLGMVAKNLLRDLRKLKNKKDKDFKHWKQLIAEIREEGNKIKKQEKAWRMVDKRMRMFLRTLKKEGVDHDSIKRMNLFGDEDNDVQMDEIMKKAYEEEHKETEQDKLLKAPIDLVRQAVKISMMMAGKNVSNFDKKNFKMVSPRFLPVVPEEDDSDDVNLLSPSLLALHNDGSGVEKETSLARAMKIFGEKDNAALLNFIMEASGVSDALDNMKSGRYTLDKTRQNDNPLYSPEGQPLWFSKENVTEIFGEKEKNKVEVFEKLQKSYTDEQMAQMNSTGYLVLNDKQIDLIYGPSSPYHDPETYKRLSNASESDVPLMLERAIRGIAEEKMKFEATRRKEIVLSPLIFTPVVLDPATASQPIILSP